MARIFTLEVLDARDGAPHQLTGGSKSVLDDYKWMKDVPPSMEYEQTNGTIDPNVCCGVPPGRAHVHQPNPTKMIYFYGRLTLVPWGYGIIQEALVGQLP